MLELRLDVERILCEYFERALFKDYYISGGYAKYIVSKYDETYYEGIQVSYEEHITFYLSY